MSAGRALVPHARAVLPAVDNAFTLDGAVAARAASVGRAGPAHAKADRDQRRCYEHSHLITRLGTDGQTSDHRDFL